MKRARTAFALGALLALAACASTGRMVSYGAKFADASVSTGTAEFSVYVHPIDNTLLLQPRLSQIGSKWPIELWRRAAETFVGPVGCGVSEVHAIAQAGGTWEATYVCPADVDLRRLVAAQRRELKAGAPLHR